METSEKEKLTDDKLKEIARDIVEGRIFTSWSVRSEKRDLKMVFMVLVLNPEIFSELVLGDCGLIYEYMSRATPRSVNGYPCFLSLRWLPRKEAKQVYAYVSKIQEAMQNI